MMGDIRAPKIEEKKIETSQKQFQMNIAEVKIFLQQGTSVGRDTKFVP